MFKRDLRSTTAMDRWTGVMSADGEGDAGGGGGGQEQAVTWYQGADAETVGHIQNRGWDKLEPGKAAMEAIKAHREAEKHIGVPADQILRMPKDASDEAGWNAVHERLGYVADPTKYDFTGVKFTDGSQLDQADQDWLRQTAQDLKLSPARALDLAGRLAKFVEQVEVSQSTEATAALEAERAKLDKDWGANKEAHMFVAKQGAARLGITPEEVASLEKVIGYARIMEAFRKVGELSGEAKFIQNNAPNGDRNGLLTREQAIARKAELMADSAWAKRYMDGGSAEAREMRQLLVIITGESGDYEAA